jgi:hypothetical protein
MGRGCEFVASIFAAQRINELCDARIVFVRKQLVQNARLLGCVSFDAAMHKQESLEPFRTTNFAFCGERTQHHRVEPMHSLSALILNELVH